MAFHLTLDERRLLYRLMSQRLGINVIASRLGRHRSTIYREIRRNTWNDDEVPQASGYWPVTARQLADARRHVHRKLSRDPALLIAIMERLKDGWSPEQISGGLRFEGGARRVCHETIYRYVYSSEGRSEELSRYLPERRRQRRPRFGRKSRGLTFPESRSIRNRPERVRKREEFGHWEADLVMFRKELGPANLATLVERTSRYTVLFRNNDRRSRPIMNSLTSLLSPLSETARRSLTFDRGLEFVSWREMERGLGAQAWICDPQAPWQKPTVENTNRRIRRWLPRETPLFSLLPGALNDLRDRMNATPRKCLGFRKPAEVFRERLKSRA